MSAAHYANLSRAQLVERLQWLEKVEAERGRLLHELQVQQIELERRADVLAESEERYRLLVEQTPDGIFVANAAGHYLDVNTAGAAMLGYTREEILRLSFPDVLMPHEVMRLPDEVARFAGGGVVVSEWQFRRKDGSRLFGEVVGRQLPDGRLQGILRDISERKQAEAALQEREFFYRQMMESIPGMVFTTRPDGYCDYQSQQWVDYTGVPMAEHLGDGWNKLQHPDDRPRSYAAWQAAVAGRAPYDIEYRVRRHDGVYEWFHVIGRPICDKDGRVVRWFGVAVNIERLKRAEEAMARQRDTLVREVHHRIKNHLQGITAMLNNRAVEQPAIAGSLAEAIAQIHTVAQVYGLQGVHGDAQLRLCDLIRLAAGAAKCRLPDDGTTALVASAEAVPVALIINELLTNAAKHLSQPDPARPVQAVLEIDTTGARIEIRSGPARLPAGFDFAQERGLGTGLELVRELLPTEGAALDFRQDGDEVVVTMTLRPPAIVVSDSQEELLRHV